ncbi:MAG: DUF4192 domain-containing protein [Nocardioides sp.]
MTDTKTLRIKNPGDLLAAVPGFLGFHPRDSVVLLTTGAAANPFHARVDMPDDHEEVDELVAHLVQVSRRAGTDQVALVVYSDDAALADLLLVTLETDLADAGVVVVVAVRADGERWFCLTGCHGDCVAEGTPYDVSTHPITVEAVVEGRVVHDSREALRDSLVGGDPDEVECVAEAMDVAMDRFEAASRHPLGPPAPEAARAHLVQEGRWVQHRVGRFVEDRQRLDAHDVGRLLVALASVEVRDVAWSEITRAAARAHVDLWRDVVRRSPLVALAPPAALLAFAAWLSGDGALAWCAVDRSQEAEPDYGMAALVAQTLACAMPPSAWEPLTPDMLSLFAG